MSPRNSASKPVTSGIMAHPQSKRKLNGFIKREAPESRGDNAASPPVVAPESLFPELDCDNNLQNGGRETIPPNVMPELQHDKRLRIIFEACVATAILLATLPVMALIALRIKTSSEGPVLFRQERVGLGGKTFRFIKFRTMYADARERFPELYAYDYNEDAIARLKFKLEDDPRVTPEGKWLRKSSLDELPNLWNVMTGKMALIGPRPEIPEMVKYYNRGDMLKKFAVRPGITGLAQASGRGNLRFLDTVALDVEYVRSRSLALDVKLFFATIWKVIRRDGAF